MNPKRAASSPAAALPDFDLAGLRGFDPTALDMTTEIGRFILVLASVFNDLKDAWYLVERARHAKPAAGQKVAWRGQLVGMTTHVTRTIAGVLHELMVSIQDHKPVVESSPFTEIVAGLPKAQRDAWRRVKRIALDEAIKDKDTDARILFFIRNKVGFHYDAKAIAKGYSEFFADTTKAFHDKAVISDGDSMEATRFYFADAAIEQGLYSWSGLGTGAVHRRISAIGQDVNFALKFIVVAYVRKVAKLSAYKAAESAK